MEKPINVGFDSEEDVMVDEKEDDVVEVPQPPAASRDLVAGELAIEVLFEM
jgi:hypothetical protein